VRIYVEVMFVLYVLNACGRLWALSHAAYPRMRPAMTRGSDALERVLLGSVRGVSRVAALDPGMTMLWVVRAGIGTESETHTICRFDGSSPSRYEAWRKRADGAGRRPPPQRSRFTRKGESRVRARPRETAEGEVVIRKRGSDGRFRARRQRSEARSRPPRADRRLHKRQSGKDARGSQEVASQEHAEAEGVGSRLQQKRFERRGWQRRGDRAPIIANCCGGPRRMQFDHDHTSALLEAGSCCAAIERWLLKTIRGESPLYSKYS